MAEEEWTVMFDPKPVGNLAPPNWAKAKNKVINAAGETKEKNTGGVNRQPGVLKTSVPQEVKIVTIVAESAEEAILAVNKFYSLGGQSCPEKVLETASLASTGPKTTTPTVGNAKMAAVVTGNLTEVAVA